MTLKEYQAVCREDLLALGSGGLVSLTSLFLDKYDDSFEYLHLSFLFFKSGNNSISNKLGHFSFV